jgi:ribose 5-phosphate isomerase A
VAANFQAISNRALALISEGNVVGLGTGRAATAFVHALGERVRAGLHIRGIPTSQATANLAKELGIPLTTLADVEQIDVTVDGADEVDPNLDLIKGLGGALVREKIVAASARQFVVVVGEEKLVSMLGQGARGKEHGILPVEVVPYALAFCRRRLNALGYPSEQRLVQGKSFVSDNGNPILDCKVTALNKPDEVEMSIRAIPGVVGTGLFLGMAHMVLVQRGDIAEVRQRKHA